MKLPSFERLRRDADAPQFDLFDVPTEAKKSFYIAMGEYLANDIHGLWCEPESRDGHCDPDKLTYEIGMQFSQLSSAYNGRVTQSPIEDMLLGAMLWMKCDWAGLPRFDALGMGPDKSLNEHGPTPDLTFWITPQANIADYRVDFLLWFMCERHSAGVVVECDGHAFHERTKEQASRDKSRDRAILLAGYPVMRFTGSEIFADSVKCAAQVGDALSEPLYQVSKASGIIP